MDKFEHVESPTLRSLLEGKIPPSTDLLCMAVDLTYLQNEYSERNDGDDFPDDLWEEMQAAVELASTTTEDPAACLAALRGYWSRWERFSTIY